MLRTAEGNLLEAPVEALVNTVNVVGVMGKGIALMMREAFPESARAYQAACKRGEMRVGRVLVTPSGSLVGPRWIIHFPTKRHWRHPSRLEWIREGLRDLVRAVRAHGIRSLAVPPLGCGSGGLPWSEVRREIESALEELPEVEILLYVPTAAYHAAAKRTGLEALTPARALIAELVRRYEVLGLECTNLEVHKLAWFLTRAVERLGLEDPLDLRFDANRYGPYADRLRHLLDGLDGSYLHSEKRLGDAGPFDSIRFEDSRRDAVDAYLRSEDARPYREALEDSARVVDGFESPLGMELLATVDWLLNREGCEGTVSAVRSGLSTWPGGASDRKLRLFDDRLVGLALDRLLEWEKAPVGE
jgi:O-acetyl-ADP-ribose deacetylase (regulator of RNase III)